MFNKENGHYYSFLYRDRAIPDGTSKSVFTRIDLGLASKISEVSAKREHDRLRQIINRERGSVPTAPKGETFEEVAKTYMSEIGPQLSIATVRQRNSHLNAHLLPRFGSTPLMGLDVQTLQRFVTELSTKGSRKSVLNILGTMSAVTAYAKRCGIRVLEIPEGSIAVADRDAVEAVYFKQADVHRIIAIAREPYRTMFVLASVTGLRAGELLGLTVADIDFDRMMICPRKQADDRTRVLRELKTKKSRTPVPITQQTATFLRTYLDDRWVPNPQGLLFSNRKGRPCKRANVVKFGLHPVLKKLGLPTLHAGLHAFRHGLGTALADAGASPAVVQRTLRHTDIKTTLRFYVHADAAAQRSALESLQNVVITTRN